MDWKLSGIMKPCPKTCRTGGYVNWSLNPLIGYAVENGMDGGIDGLKHSFFRLEVIMFSLINFKKSIKNVFL